MVNGSHSAITAPLITAPPSLMRQAGAVDHAVALALTAGFIDHGNFAVAVHDHQAAFAVDNGIEVDELERPLGTGFQRGLLGLPRRGTTDMEGPHGQLGARLADRLGGNDADRFAEVDQVTAGQVAPVAGGSRCRACSGR